MNWWREFWKADPSKVSQGTAFATVITGVLMLLSIPASIMGLCAFYHHVWTLKRGLDNSAVNLIAILIAGGGVGCGVGYGVAKWGQRLGLPSGRVSPSAPDKEAKGD
jgi:hypothetical protein